MQRRSWNDDEKYRAPRGRGHPRKERPSDNKQITVNNQSIHEQRTSGKSVVVVRGEVDGIDGSKAEEESCNGELHGDFASNSYGGCAVKICGIPNAKSNAGK